MATNHRTDALNVEEIDRIARSAVATAESILSNLLASQFSKMRALQTISQSLRTHTDRVGAAKKQYLEGIDAFAFGDVMDKVELATGMAIVLLSRRSDTLALQATALRTVEMKGEAMQVMRSILDAVASMFLITLVREYEEFAAALTEGSETFLKLMDEVFTEKSLQSAANVAEARRLSIALLDSIKAFPPVALGLVEQPNGDALAEPNVQFDVLRTGICEAAAEWADFLEAHDFQCTPTKEERVAAELKSSLQQCCNASKEVTQVYFEWNELVSALKAAKKEGDAMVLSLRPLVGRLVAAVARHELVGLDVTDILQSLNSLELNKKITNEAMQKTVREAIVELEIRLIDAVNALLAAHPRLVVVIDPSAEPEGWSSSGVADSVTLDPAAMDLLNWTRESLSGLYPGLTLTSFRDVTPKHLYSLIAVHGGEEGGPANPVPSGEVTIDMVREAAATVKLPLLVLYDVIKRTKESIPAATRAVISGIRAAFDKDSSGRRMGEAALAHVAAATAAGASSSAANASLLNAQGESKTRTATGGSGSARPKVGGDKKAKPAAAQVDNVHLEGWLGKKGHKRRNWKRRYFVLKEQVLTYYDSEQLGVQRGTMSLENSMVAMTNEHAGEFRFLIMSVESDMTLVLRADTAASRDEWISYLAAAVQGSAKKDDEGGGASGPGGAVGLPPPVAARPGVGTVAASGGAGGGGGLSDEPPPKAPRPAGVALPPRPGGSGSVSGGQGPVTSSNNASGGSAASSSSSSATAAAAAAAAGGGGGGGAAGKGAEDDDDDDEPEEQEPPVTDDLIREAAIRALQWAKRIVRAPGTEDGTRENFILCGKSLKAVLVELKDLLGLQREQRSADVYEESNTVMADLCESLFECTLTLIQTCRDIMEGISDPERAAATSKAKAIAIAKFADAISSIVFEQATKKNIRTAAMDAAKAAKVVRDSADKSELVVAAKSFVPASKRLVGLVRRRCEAMQDKDVVITLHQQCMRIMEDTQTIVSSSMEAVKTGIKSPQQQPAVDSFTNGVASIITHMAE